jgi:phosphoglycerate dehydrogenase-like enzyme
MCMCMCMWLLTEQQLSCRNMFSKEVIGKMKKGAYLVNNARGAIVDREAVVEACKSGQLGGEPVHPVCPFAWCAAKRTAHA